MLKLGHKQQVSLSSDFRGTGSSPGTFPGQIIYTSGPCFALEEICVNVWLLLLQHLLPLGQILSSGSH